MVKLKPFNTRNVLENLRKVTSVTLGPSGAVSSIEIRPHIITNFKEPKTVFRLSSYGLSVTQTITPLPTDIVLEGSTASSTCTLGKKSS